MNLARAFRTEDAVKGEGRACSWILAYVQLMRRGQPS